MGDVNFQNNNLLNNFEFLVIIKTTDSGQIEESRHHVSSSHNRERQLAHAVDEFSNLRKSTE